MSSYFEKHPILSVRNLTTSFYLMEGRLPAVQDVSFGLESGEIIAIVGESGCGKSVTARTILNVIPKPPGRIETGEVVFENTDLLKCSESEMEKIRGNRISMIFQEPMSSLNPAYTVGDQIAEVFRFHRNMSKHQAMSNAVAQLKIVGIPDPQKRAKDYPHQLSGGMRQRCMIAMALGCRPQILIADEPTTALDVTIQAQILELIAKLQAEIGMAVIIITHNLGVVASIAERVIVMYAGRIVEEGSVDAIFYHHRHPYVHGLLQSVPRIDRPDLDLREIKGIVPQLNNLPSGCSFSNRCSFAKAICTHDEPKLLEVEKGHHSRCWLEDRPW
jgi:oligopeptide/dipeptide ABC transporter ATP-binding protein